MNFYFSIRSILMIKGLVTLMGVLVLMGCAAVPSVDRGVSIGTAIDDSALELNIREALINHDSRFGEVDLVVMVHNERVVLVGRVPQANMIQSANNVVQRQSGVRLLNNQLREGNNRTSEMRLNDQWISIRVRAQLGFTREVPTQRVIVVTFAGVTYLLGQLNEQQALAAEQRAASVAGVQRVVSMFDFIDSP
jgi:osmotically-inducible protein OsmY